ncbi:flagellar hook-length control protein FliK [Rhizobium sp. L80/93]|uniref:flagellar hook-length control protein FliK n=2 Tax=Rhizobium TaxID=379 RepID=UPI001ADBC732|nr:MULTISPECIES: flagellar hook-length control protein FliK [unclassified Rhizobium]MBO9135285.1 flagellar hook-length control protein FliK [Rhizobium sp. B209b/85]MBO9187380.1 flagellar hook-length control protein FliK [Rhizobium sp. E27B/91]QXZ87292.1 flagellar hook-length control protein FliK [Rhizobium sp. K1/93]QXZ92675.1 flagellar hook-length control protein FliK [Rhizobium sp. K15/93]QXZ98906.1 flagellar hook-length control protein FliK [Rhizobium sp. B230/85]
MADVIMATGSACAVGVNSPKNGIGGDGRQSDDPHGFRDALDRSASDQDGKNLTTPTTGDAKAIAAGSASGDQNQANAASLAVPSVAVQWPGNDSVNASAQFLAAAANAVNDQTSRASVKPGDLEATSPLGLAQQLADVVAGAATGEPATPVKGDIPGVKGSKSGAASDDNKDADPNASDASVASGAVADVLSLLGASLSAAVIPAQTSASVLAAAGQLHTGNGKIDPGAASVANALPADAADDSGDAVAVGMTMLAPSMGSAGQGNAVAGTSTDGDAPVTFNVDRASGKVQSLDLSASRNADDTPQLDIKSASGDTGATVTVLDSRRFVGLADGSNSALVANSLTGNKDWAAAMQPNAALTGASATTSASKVMNTLKIQMNPDNLGIVTATMRLSGEQLSVDLKVHSAEAYRQLSNDQSAMIDSLRQQGYSVDRMTVTYTAPDTSSNNQQSPQGQQQQQPGTSQGQGSDGQARRQNSGRQAGDQDGISRAGNVGTDDSVAGGAQRARAGGVYL